MNTLQCAQSTYKRQVPIAATSPTAEARVHASLRQVLYTTSVCLSASGLSLGDGNSFSSAHSGLLVTNY